jgi:HAE1 family hydrophobic/amphiphilic exporter-1
MISPVKQTSPPEAQLPPGVRLEIIRDQSRYISAALEIDKHLREHPGVPRGVRVHAQLALHRHCRVAIPPNDAAFGMMAARLHLNSVTMPAPVQMVGIVIDFADRRAGEHLASSWRSSLVVRGGGRPAEIALSC